VRRRMLGALCLWSGGGPEERLLMLNVIHESKAAEHFEPEKALAYDRWLLRYLARHGRQPATWFESMTLREVEREVRELSEMIAAEMKPAKK